MGAAKTSSGKRLLIFRDLFSMFGLSIDNDRGAPEDLRRTPMIEHAHTGLPDRPNGRRDVGSYTKIEPPSGRWWEGHYLFASAFHPCRETYLFSAPNSIDKVRFPIDSVKGALSIRAEVIRL